MRLPVLRHPSEFPRAVKREAHRAFKRARALRLVVAESKCRVCGSIANIEGHHPNGYDEENACNVIWLCKDCHAKAHGVLNLIFGLPNWPVGYKTR